jgi:hypothetical protein
MTALTTRSVAEPPRAVDRWRVPPFKGQTMGKKLNRIYETLIEGACDGLSDDALYSHVLSKYPKTSSKRIVKAALFALSDPEVKDRAVLERIYGLAIRYRLVSLGVEDPSDDEEDNPSAPSVSHKLKTKLESSVAGSSLVDILH